MKRLVTALVGVLAVSGTLVRGVTFGEPDGQRHPYVGTIIFSQPGGFYSCSGTLLSKRVFLTAGHCTEALGQTNPRTWAKFSPSISFAGIGNYRSIEAYFDDPRNGWIKGDPVPHPQYDDFSQFPETYDVGVVLLRQPVTMSTYGALPSMNFLDSIRSSSDNHFTVVGYGMQGFIKPFASDIYERYQGEVRLVELRSTFDGGQSAKFSNNPGTGGGSCFGDSGGPIFYDGTNVVVAVVSWGNTPCIGVDYNFRTDTALALNFIRGYVK